MEEPVKNSFKINLSLFRKLLTLISKKMHFWLGASFFLIIGSALCNVFAPILLKETVDILGSKETNIYGPFISYALCLVLGRILFELKVITYAKWAQLLVKNTFNYVCSNVIKNTPEYFHNNLSGVISGKIFQSITAFKSILFTSVFQIIPITFDFLLITFSIGFNFDYSTGLITASGILVYAILLIYVNNKLLVVQNEIRNASINLEGITTDLFNCWKDIKLTNGYRQFQSTLGECNNVFFEKSITFYKKRTLFGLLQATPLLFTFIYANYKSINSYSHGFTTIGNLILINNYLLQLVKPLESFGMIFRDLLQSYSDFSLLPMLVKGNQENILKIEHLIERSKLEIKNLSKSEILNGINLSINPGDKIAIIGESGSGKTTILNILSGLDEDYSGEICINNENIKLISRNMLRNNVSFLAFDAKLISGTIKENLLLGDSSLENNLNNIASLSCILEKINSLPDRLRTTISETNNLLSTGERQRLKIARTILLNSNIILFDESTANLDPILESKILDNILSRNNTIIFVTHKTALLSKFDAVYKLESGKLLRTNDWN